MNRIGILLYHRKGKINNLWIAEMSIVLNILKMLTEFPGGPAVRTQHFHCQAWVQSLVGELRSLQAAQWGQKRKIK